MKRLSIIMLALFQWSAFAWNGIYIDVSSSNLAATYSTSYPSKALTKLPPSNLRLYVYNNAGGVVAVTNSNTCGAAPTAVATGTQGQELYLPPGSGIVLDYAGAYPCVFLRSKTGTLSTGYILIDSM